MLLVIYTKEGVHLYKESNFAQEPLQRKKTTICSFHSGNTHSSLFSRCFIFLSCQTVTLRGKTMKLALAIDCSLLH